MKGSARHHSSSQIELCRIFVMWWQNIWALVASLNWSSVCFFFFFSSGGGGVGGGTGSRVCRPLFLVSVSLCLSARLAISWDLPPSIGWPNLSECHFISSPSPLRWMSVFTLIAFRFPSNTGAVFSAWEEKWGGGGNAGIFQPGQPFSHAALAGCFNSRCRLFVLFKRVYFFVARNASHLGITLAGKFTFCVFTFGERKILPGKKSQNSFGTFSLAKNAGFVTIAYTLREGNFSFSWNSLLLLLNENVWHFMSVPFYCKWRGCGSADF